MTALFLDPHGDDVPLFACFSLLRHAADAKVVVVLRSQLQKDRGLGITAFQREMETAQALEELGITEWEQWRTTDRDPDWEAVERMMREWDEEYAPEMVFAPMREADGHTDHNETWEAACRVFGHAVTGYLTYRRGHDRSDWGIEVVPEPEWIAAKHRALACFDSQIAEPSTRPWFMDGLREWVA